MYMLHDNSFRPCMSTCETAQLVHRRPSEPEGGSRDRNDENEGSVSVYLKQRENDSNVTKIVDMGD